MAVKNGTTLAAGELWRHPDPTSTPMWRFLQQVNSRHNLQLEDYQGLYRWSVEEVALFWEEVWHFVGITASEPFHKVCRSLNRLHLHSESMLTPLCSRSRPSLRTLPCSLAPISSLRLV